MSVHNNKENSQQKKVAWDTITETLEENANLLLDQNLIYDLLNNRDKKSGSEMKSVEKEMPGYPAELSIEGDSNTLHNEASPPNNTRYSKRNLDQSERNEQAISDQGKDLSPFCQVLILELNAERQKSKDMETDLNIAKSSLSDMRRELEMLRQRDEHKSKQIDDSNRNIKSISLKCKSFNTVLSKDLDISQKQNMDLYKKNTTLESENKYLRTMVENLNEKILAWNDVQRDVTIANERYGAVLKENTRLNDDITEIRQKIYSFESDSAKQTEEMKSSKFIISSLEQNLLDSTTRSTCIQEELNQLKERHCIVREKTVYFEDQLKKTVGDNAQLQSSINVMQEEKISLRKEIHEFYKNQLHTALTQSTSEIKSRITVLESELKEKGATEFVKMSELQKIHEEKMNSVVDEYSSRVVNLTKKINSLNKENAEFRQKRDAAFRALSSHGSGEVKRSK